MPFRLWFAGGTRNMESPPDVLLNIANRYRLTLFLDMELTALALKGYFSVSASLGGNPRLALSISGRLLSHPHDESQDHRNVGVTLGEAQQGHSGDHGTVHNEHKPDNRIEPSVSTGFGDGAFPLWLRNRPLLPRATYHTATQQTEKGVEALEIPKALTALGISHQQGYFNSPCPPHRRRDLRWGRKPASASPIPRAPAGVPAHLRGCEGRRGPL